MATGLDSVAGRLRALGFERRAGLVFTLPMDGGVLGWAGLNKAAFRGRPGAVLLNPVVGVRHQGVERLVAELRGDKPHGYLPPTVSLPLRYLMSVDECRDWVVEGRAGDEAVADDLVGAVQRFGLEFMRSCGDSQGLIAALRAGHGHAHQIAYRLPAALLLAGEVTEAARVIERELEALGDRSDPAAVELREFAARLLQRLTAGDSR